MTDFQTAICPTNPDPDLWFDRKRVATAIALCEECPVREACLAIAIANGEDCGVWGARDFTRVEVAA